MTPDRFRSVFIFAASSVFYAWWRVDFLLLVYAIILWSWAAALLIEKFRHLPSARIILWAGVGGNILTLAYFKYFNFGIDTLNLLFLQAGQQPIGGVAEILLPIGISFFVFHAVSYIVDVWRKDCGETRNIFDFAAFITLFPHMIAGPILKYKDLSAQFIHRTHTLDKFSEGAYRFMVGFSQKILIADMVAPLADSAFLLENPSMADTWLGITAYSVQIYFDFWGYSNMAIGLALMIGFRFMENFDQPYLSASLTQFWRRWHISLSSWLRDYVYVPLGGNQKHEKRNVVLTMCLGGLWHGANWTFALWGLYHGLLLAIEKSLPRNIVLPVFLKIALTVFLVMTGWVLFRSPDVMVAADYYKGMFGGYGMSLSDSFVWQIKGVSLTALVCGILFVVLGKFVVARNEKAAMSGASYARIVQAGTVRQILMIFVFLIAVSRMLSQTYSPFLYFQF